MSRRTGVVGFVVAALVALPGLASGASGGLTWNGYRGVHPGESLAVAAGHLGAPVEEACGAHRVASGPVRVDDRASGGDGRVASITTTSRRVKGPDGVRVGMSDAAALRALGHRARSRVVDGHRVRLLAGPHHRVLWTVASGTSRRARVTTVGLSPGRRLAVRAATLTISGCPAPTPPPPPAPPAPPPACPDPLPAGGPYLAVSCDPETGVVAYSCTNADWRDANHEPGDGCEREVEGLVPITFGARGFCSNEAAMSLHDRIAWGQYGLGNQYACACVLANDCGTVPGGIWQVPGYDGTRKTPVVPHCSTDTSTDPSFDCPRGAPADPAPLLILDFRKQAVDAERATVVPQDVDTDHITIRARVTTQGPIAVDFMGSSCQVTLDSTAGTVPDLRLDVDLVRGADPAGPPVVQNPALTQLESSDWTLRGDTLCLLLSPGAISGRLSDYLTEVLSEWADGFLTQWCGAPDPYWWQDCPAS